MSTPTQSTTDVAALANEVAQLKVVSRKHPWRWVSGLVVFAIAAAVAVAFATSPNIAWVEVKNYLFQGSILAGVRLTILLTIVAQTIGVVGGILLAVMERSANPIMRTVSSGYIWIFRGTPALVQIIFWFNLALVFPQIRLGIPGTAFGLSWNTNDLLSPTVAAIIALGLNEAAYMAEIVRGGLLSVDAGQHDAAKAIGMTEGESLRHVILPQAVRVILPPTGNELINMLKSTSLVSVIAAEELLTSAERIYAMNFLTIELLIVASAWYLFLSTLSSLAQGFLERRLAVTVHARPPSLVSRIIARSRRTRSTVLREAL